MFRFFFFYIVVMLCLSCSQNNDIITNKDLGQTMQDLRVYQENLGDALRENNMDEAEWLHHGTDSLLQVIANTFQTHRILRKPFSYYYKKDLQKPLQQIGTSINKNDTATALKEYSLMVKRCNNCHKDYEVMKVVQP